MTQLVHDMDTVVGARAQALALVQATVVAQRRLMEAWGTTRAQLTVLRDTMVQILTANAHRPWEEVLQAHQHMLVPPPPLSHCKMQQQ